MRKGSELEDLLVHDAFVRRLARRLVRDEQGAEDLVQDTWVAALEGRSKREAKSSPRGWLGSVVRQIWSKGLRGEERRRRREGDVSRSESSDVLDDSMAREESRRILVEAIFELPDPLRTTLLLRYFEGLAPRHIARRLGLPVETVKTRLKRGLAHLRSKLDGEFEGGRAAWSVALHPFATRRTPFVVSVLPTIVIMSIQMKASLVVVALCGLLWFVARPMWEDGETKASEAARVEQSRSGLQPPKTFEEPVRSVVEAATDRTAVHIVEPEVEPVDEVLLTHGSLDILVRWSDGTPAEAVGLQLTSWATPDSRFATLVRSTNEEGRIHVEKVLAGSVIVHSERGDVTSVTILAGIANELVLDLSRGFDIEGIVFDAQREPVAGADIWVSNSDWRNGRVVMTCDHEGRFFIRSWDMMAFVGARAPGYAPSLLSTATGGEGATLQVELVLPGRAGSLSGLIRDLDGNSVRGAAVWVDMLDKKRTDGHFPPSPIQARTDASGTFLIEGVAPGSCDLKIRAGGFAPWGATVEVAIDRTTEIDALLTHGVTLTGTIMGLEGQPLAGANVALQWGPWEHSNRADPTGTFHLENLPAGEIEVVIKTDEGTTQTTLFGNPGDALVWHAQLDGGLTLAGQVVDEAGTPLEGWSVRATSASATQTFHYGYTRTDNEGRFEIFDCVDKPYRMSLSAPDVHAISLVLEDQRAFEEDLTLTVPESAMPSTHIEGIVQHADGSPAGDVQLLLLQPGVNYSDIYYPDAETGAFSIGPLPATTWTLVIMEQDRTQHRQEPQEVRYGETWNTGTIILE